MEKFRWAAFPLLVFTILVIFAPAAAAQPPAGKSLVGTITGFKPDTKIEIKPDNSAPQELKLSADTAAVRIAPGEKTLKNAATVNVTELAIGDRVLVTLDPDNINIRRIVIMSAADIGKHDEADRQDWNARGISGIVAAKDGTTITLRVRSMQGETRPAVTVSSQTKFRRYAPDSVKFADAKPSNLDEIGVGDQLRARGEKSPDGLAVTAAEVVSGTFLTTVGSVVSVDTAPPGITIKEAGSGRTVVVALTPDSRIKKISGFGAMGGPAPGGSGPPPGGFSGGPPPGGFNGMPPGGAPTIAQMVEMMPAGTVDDVKPGQTVVVSSTKGQTSDRVTAIMLLANADMLVQMATRQAGAGGGNRPGGGAGGAPQGMPQGGMDLGGMLGGVGMAGMGP